MARRIRNNDEVIIITGKNKGKVGIVKKVISLDKILIKNVNVVKKHQKSVPSKNQPGGIIRKELPIHVSNVKIFNQITKKSDRVKFEFQNGRKIRLYKSNNKVI